MNQKFVCRTCLTIIDNEHNLRKINEETLTNAINIKELLYLYISEIDLKISQNPVICDECFNKLNTFHAFKSNCVKIENAIHLYLKRNKKKKSLINLQNVLKSKQVKRPKYNISNSKKRYSKRNAGLRNDFPFNRLNSVACIREDAKLNFMYYLKLFNKSGNENNPSDVIEDRCEAQEEVADVSTSFNFNKTLYIPLKDCIAETCILNDLTEQNNSEIIENTCMDVVENISLNEESSITTQTDNSTSVKQDLSITLKREKFSFCIFCSKCFLNEALFKEHNDKCHKVCRLCNFTTVSTFKLHRHLKLKHKHQLDLLQNIQGQNLAVNCYLCPYENQLFCCNLRDHRLKNHIKRNGEGYICPYDNCNYTEKIAYLVAKHIEQIHDDDLLQCPLCNFNTNSVNKLKRHILTHNEKLFTCEVCFKGLSNIHALDSHLRTMHPNYLKELCHNTVLPRDNLINIPRTEYSNYLESDNFIQQVYNGNSKKRSSINVQLGDKSNIRRNPTNNADNYVVVSGSPKSPLTIIISDDF